MKNNILGGTVHELPKDLKSTIQSDETLVQLWQSLTPLARNEFICWVENTKVIKTRQRRIKRTCEELSEGKRRPCCWIGCIHRQDKPLSSSQKWILSKNKSSQTDK